MTTKRDKATFADAQALLDAAPWCLLVPSTLGDETPWYDPDIVGPFATSDEAEKWALSYPGAIIRKMGSPEFEIACRREAEENRAATKPKQ
jgi:hypothetical protein